MKKIKKSKNSYHHHDLRNACIERGVEIIAKTGYESLSLRSLAKDLGVSHGAPYKHFKNKNDLLAAILEKSFSIFSEHLQSGYVEGLTEAKSLQLPKKDKMIYSFKRLAFAYYRFAFEYPNHYRFMFGEAKSEHDIKSKVQDTMQNTFYYLIRIIENMQQEGLIINMNSSKLGLFVWSSIHGYTMLKLNNIDEVDEFSFARGDHMLELVADLIYQGIKYKF